MPKIVFSTFYDANTLRYWAALAVLYVLFLQLEWFPVENAILRLFFIVLVHLIPNVIMDCISFRWGYSFYDPEVIIERGYTVSAHLNDTLHSAGLDYGFNFYDGDYNKTRAQAQVDKFNYAIKQLGLKRGDRVIDIGCGCGDWLYYLKTEYGCEVAGVNITETQVIECKRRGLEVYHSNWKDVPTNPKLRNALFGRFDAVTFWDTVEHYVPCKYNRYRDKQDEIYQDMFQLAKDLMDPKSKVQRVWISCLHMAKKVWDHSRWQEKFNFFEEIHRVWYIYILDRFHSGFYPSNYYDPKVDRKRDQLVDNAAKKDVKIIWRRNVTYDYYITSVLEPTHFGRHKFSFNPWRLFFLFSFLLIDPQWIHRWIWFASEDWMFQFDPKNIDNSDVILWWLVFQA